MWFILALLSAVFAALTSILAKAGIEGVPSNLATAIRTAVVLVMAWGMVFLTNTQGGIGDISQTRRALGEPMPAVSVRFAGRNLSVKNPLSKRGSLCGRIEF